MGAQTFPTHPTKKGTPPMHSKKPPKAYRGRPSKNFNPTTKEWLPSKQFPMLLKFTDKSDEGGFSLKQDATAAGWFSRRHRTSEAHTKAQDQYRNRTKS